MSVSFGGLAAIKVLKFDFHHQIVIKKERSRSFFIDDFHVLLYCALFVRPFYGTIT